MDSTDGMVRLWQSVLAQMINDALADNPYSPENRRAHIDAVRWFDRGGRDFDIVCTYAGQDPEFVREAWLSKSLTRIPYKTYTNTVGAAE